MSGNALTDSIPLQIELAHPEQEWKLHNAWFVKQKNFHTIFKPRKVI